MYSRDNLTLQYKRNPEMLKEINRISFEILTNNATHSNIGSGD